MPSAGTSSIASCQEAGLLLQRASRLGTVQVDACRDLVARAAVIAAAASDEELRGHFLPPLLAAVAALSEAEMTELARERPLALCAISKLLDEAEQPDSTALANAIADVFRSLAGLETTRGN